MIGFYVYFAVLAAGTTPQSCADERPQPGVVGYGWRQNRCEGLVVRQVSGGIVPYSFTRGRVVLPNDNTVMVSWDPLPTDDEIMLSTESMDSKSNYVMRARVASSKVGFSWPTLQMAAEKISELAVRALNKSARYIPVYVGPTARDADYVAAFYSSDNLAQITVRVRSAKNKEVFRTTIGGWSSRVIAVTIPKAIFQGEHEFSIKLQGLSASGPLSSEIKVVIP